MRSIFPGHFRPSADGFRSLWSDCVFAVDANVLLNLYRYSPETRTELERTLASVRDRLFVPHQAAREFLKNRLGVTVGQAEEYTKAMKAISDLSATLSNKKKHPFLPEAELPKFNSQVGKLVEQLESQRTLLLNRLINDEILEFVESIFEGRTGSPFDDATLKSLTADGDLRYQSEIPPGYKDGKKDASGDPYRKFGDLIVWKQLIAHAKTEGKPIVFITDDKKEDWWLEQSGRTIGPRTELRDEFIAEVAKEFWMYTVDKFIEEAARIQNTQVSEKVIEEIIQVSHEVQVARTAISESEANYFRKAITRDEMLDRLRSSERWAAQNSEGFLGLHSYVKGYLGHAGFDYSASFDMIRQLEEAGLVEVYDHRGEGHERSVRAIRLVQPNQFSNRPLAGLKSLLDQPQNDKQLDGS